MGWGGGNLFLNNHDYITLPNMSLLSALEFTYSHYMGQMKGREEKD